MLRQLVVTRRVNQLRHLGLETFMTCKPCAYHNIHSSVPFSSSHELLHMFELTSVSAVYLCYSRHFSSACRVMND